MEAYVFFGLFMYVYMCIQVNIPPRKLALILKIWWFGKVVSFGKLCPNM